MPRTEITVQQHQGQNDATPLTFVDFDEANGMFFECRGGEVIFLRTPSSGVSVIELEDVAEPGGWRAPDAAKQMSVAASASPRHSVKGPLKQARWRQSDGNCNLNFISKTGNTPQIAVMRGAF